MECSTTKTKQIPSYYVYTPPVYKKEEGRMRA